MSSYMVLYRSSLGPGEQMGTPEQAQKGLQAWMNWAGQAARRWSTWVPLLTIRCRWPRRRDRRRRRGYSVLEADSLESVKKLLVGHPHLSAPGGSFIEILEYLPSPVFEPSGLRRSRRAGDHLSGRASPLRSWLSLYHRRSNPAFLLLRLALGFGVPAPTPQAAPGSCPPMAHRVGGWLPLLTG